LTTFDGKHFIYIILLQFSKHQTKELNSFFKIFEGFFISSAIAYAFFLFTESGWKRNETENGAEEKLEEGEDKDEPGNSQDEYESGDKEEDIREKVMEALDNIPYTESTKRGFGYVLTIMFNVLFFITYFIIFGKFFLMFRFIRFLRSSFVFKVILHDKVFKIIKGKMSSFSKR
jgi:hypothetical protein